MLNAILAIVASYLFASLPHLKLLCHVQHVTPKGDLHHELWQKAGPIWGILGVSGDVLKGLLPVLTARALGLDISIVVVCGLTAVCGQMWPVFDHFNGEKGNTTGLGASFALAWTPMLIGVIPMASGVLSKFIKLLGLRGSSLSNRLRTGAGRPICFRSALLSVSLSCRLLPGFCTNLPRSSAAYSFYGY